MKGYNLYLKNEKLNSIPLTKEGYDVVYSIGIGLEVIAIIFLMFVNTGRSRKAQQEYAKENESKKDETKDNLLKEVGQDEEKTPDGNNSTKTNDDENTPLLTK